MRGLTLSCPFAYYAEGMRIRCSRSENGGGACAFQYFKRCKGWWALLPAAADCKLRREAPPEEGGNTE